MLATTGAAVGLGNVWRFPFLAGENGGGAFVLVYLAFVFLIGVPVITAELALGRPGLNDLSRLPVKSRLKTHQSELARVIHALGAVVAFQ